MESVKKGSFTVEAALIMPVILLVVFGVLRCGLLLQEEIVQDLEVLQIFERKEMEEKHIGDTETGRPDYEKILETPERKQPEDAYVFHPAEYKRRTEKWQR
ncbi:MAG: TadE family protein [Acetivibrio ethanolgignens]